MSEYRRLQHCGYCRHALHNGSVCQAPCGRLGEWTPPSETTPCGCKEWSTVVEPAERETPTAPNGETFREQVERLIQMSRDDGETWDLSANDQAALKAVLQRMAVLDAEVDRLRRQVGHDVLCESESTSHGYTPCRCAERAAAPDRAQGERETPAAPDHASAMGVFYAYETEGLAPGEHRLIECRVCRNGFSDRALHRVGCPVEFFEFEPKYFQRLRALLVSAPDRAVSMLLEKLKRIDEQVGWLSLHRDGSPNAFYAHFDALAKQWEAVRALLGASPTEK